MFLRFPRTEQRMDGKATETERSVSEREICLWSLNMKSTRFSANISNIISFRREASNFLESLNFLSMDVWRWKIKDVSGHINISMRKRFWAMKVMILGCNPIKGRAKEMFLSSLYQLLHGYRAICYPPGKWEQQHQFKVYS